jgi:1L-myo-inositol 1-phosphate cytidylyltransferase
MAGDGKRKNPAMKCLIIAAGQGTRLRPVAESKPLAAIRGVPLIEHVIRAAQAGGASEFVVVTGYRAEPLEDFLGGLAERLDAPMATVRNPEWMRPNGLSVVAAGGLVGPEFLLVMSDHLFDPAIVRRLLAERLAGAALTLAVDRRLDAPGLDLDDATKVATAGDGRIRRIGKVLTEFDAVDTGIFLTGPALIEAIEASLAEGGAGSLSEGVQALADQGGAWTRDIGASWWADVDDETALRRAEATMPRGI